MNSWLSKLIGSKTFSEQFRPPRSGGIGHEKVLVRCPNWVGDMVLATPALRAIRNRFPDAKILLVMRSYLKGLIEGSPWYDEIIEVDAARRLSRWEEELVLALRLRKERIHLAVLLTNSFESALMTWLTSARRRVGYRRDCRSIFLTDGVEPARDSAGFLPISMVDYYLGLCEEAGVTGRNVVRHLELFAPEKDETTAESMFKDYGLDQASLIVGLNPGAAFGSSKYWDPRSFAEIGDHIVSEHGGQVLILFGPGEEQTALQIQGLMRNDAVIFKEHVPLSLLKSIIKRCNLFITTDSGPRHIATAFGRPVVVLMGPTDPRWSESETDKIVVLGAEVECSPCHLRQCPTDHACMKLIKPDAVIQKLDELIEAGV